MFDIHGMMEKNLFFVAQCEFELGDQMHLCKMETVYCDSLRKNTVAVYVFISKVKQKLKHG